MKTANILIGIATTEPCQMPTGVLVIARARCRCDLLVLTMHPEFGQSLRACIPQYRWTIVPGDGSCM